MIKKIITFFMLLLLVAKPVAAQEAEEGFVSVTVGDKVPYTGFLFTPEALAKIYSGVEEQESKLKLEHKLEIDKLNLEIKKINTLMLLELKSKESIIENITTSKNKTIGELTGQVAASRWYIAGSFLGGILLTGSLVYFVSGMNK